MRTDLFFTMVIALLFGNKCIAQQITSEPQCTKAYRHIFFEECEKYFDGLIVDTFQYLFRPDFRCRYLDEDYLLCHIIQVNDTIDVAELPFSVDLYRKYDVKVLDVNVQIIEQYRSRDNPLIYTFFDEQLFREEYLGEKNYGLFDYVAYIDSCVKDTTNICERLFLLVTNEEIPIISSYQGEKDSVLCNISRIIENQVYYSDIIYFQMDYNTKDFFSLSEWNSFLHQRIDKIVRTRKKKD